MNSSEVIGFVFNKIDGARERIADEIVEECRIRWEVINMYGQKLENEKIVNMKKNENKSNVNAIRHKTMIIDDITAVLCFF